MFELLDTQGALVHRNPTQPLMQLHAGEAAAVALALEESWWLLVNEQRALILARQRNLKAVTVPEFIVYLYQSQLLSARSAQVKLGGIAANTGQRVMRTARDEFEALAQSRGER
jgi:predicted nucleic acid-binding protein